MCHEEGIEKKWQKKEKKRNQFYLNWKPLEIFYLRDDGLIRILRVFCVDNSANPNPNWFFMNLVFLLLCPFFVNDLLNGNFLFDSTWKIFHIETLKCVSRLETISGLTSLVIMKNQHFMVSLPFQKRWRKAISIGSSTKCFSFETLSSAKVLSNNRWKIIWIENIYFT